MLTCCMQTACRDKEYIVLKETSQESRAHHAAQNPKQMELVQAPV